MTKRKDGGSYRMPTRNANNNSRDCIVKVKAYCFDFFKCNVLQIRFQLSIHMCIDIREPFFFFWKSSIFFHVQSAICIMT